MLIPCVIFPFRKRLYSLGLRFSFFTDFLPSCAMVLSCWAIVFCCFLSISVCDLMVVLKSLNSVLWLFSSVASLLFSLLMSARMDFGIPDVFGMSICSFDEKKSIPHGPETPVCSWINQRFGPRPEKTRPTFDLLSMRTSYDG